MAVSEDVLGESSSAPWLKHLLSESKAHGLSYIDVEAFFSSTFDPQEYANTIIDAPSSQRETDVNHGSPARANWLPQSGRVEGDLSLALGRLNLAIDDVDRIVRDEVTNNASTLLAQTNALLDVRPALGTLTSSLDALESHQAKLVSRISTPRKELYTYTSRLSRIRSAHMLVKHAQRLVRLLRRLQGQMQSLNDRRGGDEKNRLEKLGEEDVGDESIVGGAVPTTGDGNEGVEDFLDTDVGDQHTGRGLSRAALTVAEIMSLLHQNNNSSNSEQDQPDARASSSEEAQDDDEGSATESASSLLDLAFVQQYMPFIEEARERITDLMENMIVRGLRDLSPTMLSTSLQTAYNLGQLTELVRDLLADLTDVVRDRVRAAFDMQSLSRELNSKEPQVQQATNYRTRRVEYSSASHQRWTNAIWQRFETLMIGEMGAVCSKVYTLERVLSLKKDTSSTRHCTYLDKAMDVLGDRPSAMFWSTLANAIDREARQATSPFLLQTLEFGYPRLLRLFQEFYAKISVYAGTTYTHAQQSPETLVVLRSLARFEDSFLAKSSAHFEQLLSSSFTSRHIPGATEGMALGKLALGELDAARLDPLLLHAMGKNVCEWLRKAILRIEGLAVHDGGTQTLNTLTPSHVNNASLTMAAYQLSQGLVRAAEQGPSEYRDKLTELNAMLIGMQEKVLVEPLLFVICKDISDIVSRMHYVDFSLDRDAVSGSGSAYMADLSDRLWFVREQLFVHYDLPTSAWLLRIAKHALSVFVMQASLIRPLAEGGKLKLTSDMTELEFSISQLLASVRHARTPLSLSSDGGREFAALRSFRHLLFTDAVTWTPDEALQAGLSPLAAAHHVLARSRTIMLPHELHSWTRAEYVRWLDGHSTQDGMQLIRGCIDAWKAGSLRSPSSANGVDDDEEAQAKDKEKDQVLIACSLRILEASL